MGSNLTPESHVDTIGWKHFDVQIALELPRQYIRRLCYGRPEDTEEQFTDVAAEAKFKEGFQRVKGFLSVAGKFSLRVLRLMVTGQKTWVCF